MLQNSPKAAPVYWAAPKFVDSLFMNLGWISFVLGKTKLRIIIVIHHHKLISGYLGNN